MRVNGTSVLVDDTYIRESILTPQLRLTAGYQPLMPTFQELVNEEGLMSLIAHIKALPAARPAGPAAQASAAIQAAPAPGDRR